MEQGQGFEYLEHTADLRFKSYGRTLGECYANSAKAMCAALVEPSTVEDAFEKKIKICADSRETLLHDYLTEILFLFETEDLLFSAFEAEVDGGKNCLTGTFRGEKYDPKKHSLKTEIKAVTYHRMEIKREKDKWTAEVLCDI